MLLKAFPEADLSSLRRSGLHSKMQRHGKQQARHKKRQQMIRQGTKCRISIKIMLKYCTPAFSKMRKVYEITIYGKPNDQ